MKTMKCSSSTVVVLRSSSSSSSVEPVVDESRRFVARPFFRWSLFLLIGVQRSRHVSRFSTDWYDVEESPGFSISFFSFFCHHDTQKNTYCTYLLDAFLFLRGGFVNEIIGRATTHGHAPSSLLPSVRHAPNQCRLSHPS